MSRPFIGVQALPSLISRRDRRFLDVIDQAYFVPVLLATFSRPNAVGNAEPGSELSQRHADLSESLLPDATVLHGDFALEHIAAGAITGGGTDASRTDLSVRSVRAWWPDRAARRFRRVSGRSRVRREFPAWGQGPLPRAQPLLRVRGSGMAIVVKRMLP